MPIAGPFYYAWVDPTETTFNSSHYRMDEYIFSAKRTIAEGEKPLLEIEIQNPHVGILSPGRKYWAWFAWNNGSEIVPLFFGRVVGTPAQIFEEVIQIQLVSWPIDYKQQVQQAAETLKVRPFYDPVFIDVGKRDDPDTILEATAMVWDVDPVTLVVTANSIIDGDSNQDFTGDDHFYDSMQMTIGQPPATAILMDASVSWTQTSRGVVYVGTRIYSGIGGDGIIADWPKPLTSLGGGYTVYASDAYDTAGAADAELTSISWSYNNRDSEHSDGDTLSKSWSFSTPVGGTIWRQMLLNYRYQAGFTDPWAVDVNGDPAPVNIPMNYSDSTGYVMAWNVVGSLTLQYDAARQRTERAVFTVRADTQPVLVDPLISQDTEVMTKSGADVGVPIINLLDWTTISGTDVSVGQVIFPDNPSVPSSQTAQICVVAGTAGTIEPDFSDVPGIETADGSATWSSLGTASPTDNAPDWTPVSNVNAGTLILPKRPNYISYYDLLAPTREIFTVSNVPVSQGEYVQMPDGSFMVCVVAGTYPGGAQFTVLSKLPSGNNFFICTTPGITGPQYLIPPFNESLHATTRDGSVVWTCVGGGEIPAGGIPGEVHAATYFATDRGLQSLEYLASLVRAKLLYRSRCVEISFDCEYGRGAVLTTRQTVTLHDPRIAGGIALGKVKGAELTVSDTGVAGCHVTIACAAGLGNAVTEQPGDAGYVDLGYVDGYQQYDNVTVVLPDATDLGYAPPIYTVTDDGISFPATLGMILVSDAYHQGADVSYQALTAMAAAAQKAVALPPTNDLAGIYAKQREVQLLSANTLAKLMQEDPSWQEFQFKPVNSGPFNRVYDVQFSNLQIPKGIDLQSDTIT